MSKYLGVCTLVPGCGEPAVYWTYKADSIIERSINKEPSEDHNVGACRTHGSAFKVKIRTWARKNYFDPGVRIVEEISSRPFFVEQPKYMIINMLKKADKSVAIWPHESEKKTWWAGEQGKKAVFMIKHGYGEKNYQVLDLRKEARAVDLGSFYDVPDWIATHL